MLNSFNTSMDGQMGTLIPLLATASKKERQKYLDQLDKKFTQSDEKLENLIRQHQKQLNSLSNIFSSVSSNIKESKEKLVLIRNSLNSSKNLLSCKRRQIRDYWTKSVREKYTIEYLKKMESVNETLADFKYLTKNNRIYEAVNRIKLSLSYLENDFADFNALSVVKITIQSTIMDSINEYKKILIDIIYEKNINFSKENVRRSTFVTADLSKIQSKDSVIRNLKDLSNDFLPLLAENPLDFIHLHLYALWTLDGLDHFINQVLTDLKSCLENIVKNSTRSIMDIDKVGKKDCNKLLLKMFTSILSKCKDVLFLHSIIIKIINLKYSKIQEHYTLQHVWNEIQNVIISVLERYLNPDKIEYVVDINKEKHVYSDINYFYNKKTLKKFNNPKFTFESSNKLLNISNNEFRLSQNMLSTNIQSLLNLVKPSKLYITILYEPLQNFVISVHNSYDLIEDYGAPNTIFSYVKDFITNKYIAELKNSINETMRHVLNFSESIGDWTSYCNKSAYNLERPTLRSCRITLDCLHRLWDNAYTLPRYKQLILEISYTCAEKLIENVHTSSRESLNIDKLTSFKCLKVKDIENIIEILPSWKNISDDSIENNIRPTSLESDKSRCTSISNPLSEENEFLKKKQCYLILTTLKDDIIKESELLSDLSKIRYVCNVHYSFVWLSSCIKTFLIHSTLLQPNNDYENDSTHEIASKFNIIKTQFDTIAELYILILHIEMKILCYYFILYKSKSLPSSYFIADNADDNDNEISILCKILRNYADTIQHSLPHNKFKFIFDGLGSITSILFFEIAGYLRKINKKGINKMTNQISMVQKTLSDICMTRENELENSRTFYDYLRLSPDEIVALTLEKGDLFSLGQYEILLKLSERSRSMNDDELKTTHEERMEKIKQVIYSVESEI